MFLLTVAMILATGGAQRAHADNPPNVLLIISDDLGWPFYHFMIQELRREHPGPGATAFAQRPAEASYHDETCTPARNQFPTSTCRICQPHSGDPTFPGDPGALDLDICTPNLDQLANEGAVFYRGYSTAPDCDSSRPSIFTGLNRHDLTGSGGGCGTKAVAGPQTIGEALKSLPLPAPHKYWNLLAGKLEASGNGPNSLDFDYFDQSGSVGEQKGLQFIKGFLAGSDKLANGDPKLPNGDPWFIVFSPKTPHFQYVLPPTGFADLYQNQTVGVADMDQDVPGFFTGNGSVPDPDHYFPSITYLDARVGELLQFLQDLEGNLNPNPAYDPFLGPTTTGPAYLSSPTTPGRSYAGFSRNTLVIYVGDNGAALPHSKASFGENGQRTPTIVRPPPNLGGVTQATRDQVKYDLVGNIDVFPTILAYVDPNETLHPGRRWPDGRNLRRRIEGCDSARPYFFSGLNTDGNGAVAVRDAQYKLYANVVKSNGVTHVNPSKCIDLNADPFEEGPPGAISVCGALQAPLTTWALERMTTTQGCKESLTECACGRQDCNLTAPPSSCGSPGTMMSGSSTEDPFCPAP